MTRATMWKPPTRREYNPKPMDPGQRITWQLIIGGHYTVPPHYDTETNTYTEGAGWVEPETYERSGVIWSPGPAVRTWWAVPDDEPLTPVVVRYEGRRGKGADYDPGKLYESRECQDWRIVIRRAENVRKHGVYAVAVTEPKLIGKGPYASYSSVLWHCDPGCPQADGYDRTGRTDGWTLHRIVDVLTGRERFSGEPPFCKHCIMLEPAPDSEPEPVAASSPRCQETGPQQADTVPVWDVDADETREVTRAEAAAGMVRYARREMGAGTPACGEYERRAVALLERDPEPEPPAPVPPSEMPAWRPAVNGTSKRPWFVARGYGTEADHLPVEDRYHSNKNGDLIRYGSCEAAQRVADRLNAAENADPEPAVTAWRRRQKVTKFSVCVICHESTLVSDLNNRCECVECVARQEAGGLPDPAPEPEDITEEGEETMNGDNSSNEPERQPGEAPDMRPAPLPGVTILDEIEGFINRHVHLPAPHNARVMALMAAASYATPVFPATFRGLFAGEPQSGKTTAMMVTVNMSANPVNLAGTEPAARSAILGAASTPELGFPTFYLDDIKLFGADGMGTTRDMRADVLRRGYKVGETLGVSRSGVDKRFNISAPFHMSGLEAVVPEDVRTRCIVLWHEAGEAEQYFDLRFAVPLAREYGKSLGEAVGVVLGDLEAFRGYGYHPKLKGRLLEIWEPLLAVAKHVGGQKWVNYCVKAFEALTGNGSAVRELTPRQKVIRDAVTVMDGPLAWAAGQGFIPGDLLGAEFARLTEGGKPKYAGMNDNALLQHVAANMTGITKRQVGGLLKRGYPIDRMMGYLAQDIRDEWDAIRPPDPADVEAPESVSPFEPSGEDDGDLDALLQGAQGVQGVQEVSEMAGVR